VGLLIDAARQAGVPVAAATFTFESADAAAAFECSLDGAEFTGCSSPSSYALLTSGEHSFAVRARDPAGNTGAPATRRWTIEPPGNDAEPGAPGPGEPGAPGPGDPGAEPAPSREPQSGPPPSGVTDPGPETWPLPELELAVPSRQTVRRALARGVLAVATIGGSCPCVLGYVVRLARAGRAPSDDGAPVVARLELTPSTSGRLRTRIALARTARFGRQATARARVALTR
jgi:hypothetical protein